MPMQRIELKRIVEFLWRTSQPDEKTPFAPKSQLVTNNGTIATDSKLNNANDNTTDCEKNSENSGEKKEDTSPMSLSRKFCFFLSLNMCALYFVVLAWILPCNELVCFPKSEWKRNITDIFATTNLETQSQAGLPSLAMFGYVNDGDGKVIALAASDGKVAWNISVSFIPRRILCNLETSFDANSDGVPDCITASFDDIAAFSAADGSIIWQTNITSSEGSYIKGLSTARNSENITYILIISGGRLYALDAMNGRKITVMELPCLSPVDVLLKPWLTAGNSTVWCLVCEYGDAVDVWTFREEDVLKSAKNFFEDAANYTEFKLLLRDNYNERSMSFSSDVTSTQDFLVFSWADTVTMVTAQAPFHLHRSWKRSFNDPSGYPFVVTHVISGHFTNSEEMQIALGVQEGTNSTIHVLNQKNGSTIDSISVGKGRIFSIKKIPGRKVSKDAFVVEVISQEYVVEMLSNFSIDPWPMPPQSTTYFLIEHSEQGLTVNELATSMYVTGSSLDVQSDGSVDLFMMNEVSDRSTIINKVHLKSSQQRKNSCIVNENDSVLP